MSLQYIQVEEQRLQSDDADGEQLFM